MKHGGPAGRHPCLVKGFDLVIMDEARSIVDQMLSSETNGKFLGRNARYFYALLSRPGVKVVALDADLESDGAVPALLQHIATSPSAIRVERYTQNPTKRKFYVTRDRKQLIDRVKSSAKAGEKTAIACATKACAEAWEQLIKKERPDLKAVLITGDVDDSLKKSMQDPDTFLKNFDVLVFTSAVSVGADVQLPWHLLLVDASSRNGCGPRQLLQMMGRFRKMQVERVDVLYPPKPTKADVSYTLCHRLEKARRDLRERETDIKQYQGMIRFQETFDEDGTMLLSPDWFTELHIYARAEKLAQFEEEFKRQAGRHQFQLIMEEEEAGQDEGAVEFKEYKELAKTERENLLKDAFDVFKDCPPEELHQRIKELKEKTDANEASAYEKIQLALRVARPDEIAFHCYTHNPTVRKFYATRNRQVFMDKLSKEIKGGDKTAIACTTKSAAEACNAYERDSDDTLINLSLASVSIVPPPSSEKQHTTPCTNQARIIISSEGLGLLGQKEDRLDQYFLQPVVKSVPSNAYERESDDTLISLSLASVSIVPPSSEKQHTTPCTNQSRENVFFVFIKKIHGPTLVSVILQPVGKVGPRFREGLLVGTDLTNIILQPVVKSAQEGSKRGLFGSTKKKSCADLTSIFLQPMVKSAQGGSKRVSCADLVDQLLRELLFVRPRRSCSALGTRRMCRMPRLTKVTDTRYGKEEFRSCQATFGRIAASFASFGSTQCRFRAYRWRKVTAPGAVTSFSKKRVTQLLFFLKRGSREKKYTGMDNSTLFLTGCLPARAACVATTD
eukprot:g26132.t1